MLKALKDIKREETLVFGGKATNLGFLMQNNFNVPEGFCISTDGTYNKEELIKKFNEIKPVSVRSSATCEDSSKASFAGQFDTILDVKTEEELIKAIKKCKESVNSDRVKVYMKSKDIKDVKMAVIIQQMVKADFAGVAFSVDPINKKDILEYSLILEKRNRENSQNSGS